MAEPQYQFDNPLLGVYFLTPEQKKDKKEGLAIARAFYTQQINNKNSLNYFSGRNARWIELLLWAKGSQPMQEFLDYMSVSDANKSYVNIDMTQQRIAAQFVGTVIESLSKNKVYPCVSAVDDGSLTEKEQRKRDALYRMHDKENIQMLEQAGGMPLEPVDAYVPNDELTANVYFEFEDRLPKEIRFEEMLAKTFNNIKFERVLNRKGLYDIIVLNCEVTKIDKVSEGNYTVRKCVPTNVVYNFFLNDTGECEIVEIGEFYNLKVKDFRVKYGKSETNPNGLTEQEIFELAKASTIQNNGTFNITWNSQWGYNNFMNGYNVAQPYDDYSIYVFDFEKDCGEDMFFVEKTDNFGKPNIQQKKTAPYQQKDKNGNIIEQPKPDDVNIIKKNKNIWMRGVYAPYGDKMLYWGQPDVIISPYTDIYKTLSSYSINIPNNDGQYVPSLFERILEPLREYTITKLKRKLLISQVKPFGIRIDVENTRNLGLGTGDDIAWEEVVRIYNQTGNELWSSKGVNPLENVAPPLSNGIQDTTVQKIIELTNVLASIIAEIRMLIGSSVYLEGGDLGDRTAAKLAENQTENASNVFGYVYNGHLQVWEETCYKLTCLHWNDIVKQEPESENDLINTRFEAKVQIKATEYERQLLEQNIQTWSQVIDGNGNPLITPKDALRLRTIENFKLAELYLSNVIEERQKRAEQEKAKRAKENIDAQQQTAKMSADAAAQMQSDKLTAEEQLQQIMSKNKKEEILLQGIMDIAGNGMQLPPEMKSLVQLLVPNIAMGLAMDNKGMQQGIEQMAQQEQMQAMQEQMEAEQGQQEPQGQEMPQEQMEQQQPMQQQPQMQ